MVFGVKSMTQMTSHDAQLAASISSLVRVVVLPRSEATTMSIVMSSFFFYWTRRRFFSACQRSLWKSKSYDSRWCTSEVQFSATEFCNFAFRSGSAAQTIWLSKPKPNSYFEKMRSIAFFSRYFRPSFRGQRQQQLNAKFTFSACGTLFHFSK